MTEYSVSNREVLSYFDVLGGASTLEHKFHIHKIDGWLSPSFSPIVLLPGNKLSISDLLILEEYSLAEEKTNILIDKRPYFCFFESDYSTRYIDTILHGSEWKRESVPLSINIMNNTHGNLGGESGLRFLKTKVTDGKFPDAHKNMLMNNFSLSDDIWGFVEKLYASSGSLTYSGMIFDNNCNALAAGIISEKDRKSFLTWGTVNREYRGNGVSHLLASSLKGIAHENGSDISILTTRNPAVCGRSEIEKKLYICRMG